MPLAFVNTLTFSSSKPAKGQLVTCDFVVTGLAKGPPGTAGLISLGFPLPKFHSTSHRLLLPNISFVL